MLNMLATSAMGMPGWQEMMVLALVALVIFGPKRLPMLARSLGQTITELKRGISGVQNEIEDAADQAKKSVKEAVTEAKKGV